MVINSGIYNSKKNILSGSDNSTGDYFSRAKYALSRAGIAFGMAAALVLSAPAVSMAQLQPQAKPAQKLEQVVKKDEAKPAKQDKKPNYEIGPVHIQVVDSSGNVVEGKDYTNLVEKPSLEKAISLGCGEKLRIVGPVKSYGAQGTVLNDLLFEVQDTHQYLVNPATGGRAWPLADIDPVKIGVKPGQVVIAYLAAEKGKILKQTVPFFVIPGTCPEKPIPPTIQLPPPAPVVPQPSKPETPRIIIIPTVCPPERTCPPPEVKEGYKVAFEVIYGSDKSISYDFILFSKRVTEELSIEGGLSISTKHGSTSVRSQDDLQTNGSQTLDLTTDNIANFERQRVAGIVRFMFGKIDKTQYGTEIGLGQEKVSLNYLARQLATDTKSGQIIKEFECNSGNDELNRLMFRLGFVVDAHLYKHFGIGAKVGFMENGITRASDKNGQHYTLSEKIIPYAGIEGVIRF